MTFLPIKRFARTVQGLGTVLCLLAALGQTAFAVDPVTLEPETRAVIGGTAATASKPWAAALIQNSTNPDSKTSSRLFCGGTLIAPMWVVTAAHCVDSKRAGMFKVLLGRADLDGTGGELVEVSEVIVEQYWEAYRHADIAMLRLKTAVKEDPLALPTSIIDKGLPNTAAKVYGWGYDTHIDAAGCKVKLLAVVSNTSDYTCNTEIFSSGDKPASLMEGVVKIASYADCQARFADYEKSLGTTGYPTNYFSDSTSGDLLCGWDDANVQTPCYGDSGGPLVATINGNPFLVGIVSAGLTSSCAAKQEVESFTRVYPQLWFIYDAMVRTQSYGFDALCPQAQTVDMVYIPVGGTSVATTAQWTRDDYASGYRLYYAFADSLGQNINYIDLPPSNTSFNIVLTSGQRFHIAVQSKGTNCDGPVSAMKEVIVP